MKARPEGFEIEQFEPQRVDMNIDLNYENKEDTNHDLEFDDGSNNTEQLLPESPGIYGGGMESADPVR